MASSSNTHEMIIRRMAFPALLIGGALLAGFFVNPLAAWGVVAAAMVGAILLGRAGALLFVFWLWASIEPLVAQYISNPAVRYLDEILMLAVLAVCLGNVILRHQRLGSAQGMARFFYGLLLVLLLSFLINPKQLVNTMHGAFTYYLFPIIFFSAMLTVRKTRKTMLLFVSSFLSLFVLHLILNLGWFFHINPLRNKFVYSTVDFAQGTFGSSAQGAYFSSAVFFLCLTAGVKSVGRKRFVWVSGGLLALMNLYLAHTNHAYLIVAVLYVLFLLLFPQGRRLKLGLALCALAVAFFLPRLERAFLSTEHMYQEDVGRTLSQESLSHRWRTFKLSPKVRLLDRIVVQNARDTPMEWLIGMGPGMGVSVVGMKKVSPKALEYLAEYYHTRSGARQMMDGSVMSSAYSGIFSIWSEVGLIGFLLYISLYIYPWVRVWKQFKNKVYFDSVQLLLVENFLLVIPLFLMVNVLKDLLWADYFVVGLWLWAALVWNPIKELPLKIKEGSDEIPSFR